MSKKLSDRAKEILINDLGQSIDVYHKMARSEYVRVDSQPYYREIADYLSDIRKELRESKK